MSGFPDEHLLLPTPHLFVLLPATSLPDPVQTFPDAMFVVKSLVSHAPAPSQRPSPPLFWQVLGLPVPTQALYEMLHWLNRSSVDP